MGWDGSVPGTDNVFGLVFVMGSDDGGQPGRHARMADLGKRDKRSKTICAEMRHAESEFDSADHRILGERTLAHTGQPC
jgi:hypothetical protein